MKKIVFNVNGVSLDILEVPDDVEMGGNWVDYDPAIHDPIYPVRERIQGAFVNRDVFLFDLFSEQEQIILATQLNRIDAAANWSSDKPTMVEGAYRALFVAQKQLENVEQVRLRDQRTERFLSLCAILQIFGPDSATQLRRITMIQYGIKP